MKHINAEIDDKVRDIRLQETFLYFFNTLDYMNVHIKSRMKYNTIERLSIATLRNLEKEIGYGKH